MKTPLRRIQNSHRAIPALLVGVAIFAIGAQVSAVAPVTAPAGSSFNDRLVLRKQEQNIQLTEETTRHIQGTCTRAQSILRAKQSTTAAAMTKRNDTYNKIDSYMWVTIGQLKLANQPTFNLEQQRGAFAQKAVTFQTNAASYQQSLDDLLVINCQSDPAGFQALLNTARAFYTQVAANSQDMRDYTVNTLKPSLQTAIDALQTPSDTTDDGGN